MTVFHRSIRSLACAGAVCVFASVASAADFTLARDLDTRADTTCSAETAFGSFVADALKKVHGAEIGLVNCTAIRGNRTYAIGSVFDAAAASAEIAPDAKLVQIEVTGLQLLEALEQAVSSAPSASNAFVQISGIRMVVDATKPAGQRVVKLTSNAAALDFAKTYSIATTEEVVKTLALFASAKRVVGQSTAIAADVAAHLEAVGVRDIKVLGRVKTAQ